ncbi:MAG TPA: class I tRNA ligase family protein, partial [Candidatus Paceibacterota bacterium]
GTLTNSGQFDRLESDEAKKKITEFVGGKITTTYKLKDWVFSRQRYWGEPIPIIHCPKDGAVPVPEAQLPVLLPEVKSYEPSGTGESPLAAIVDWVNTTCPKCGGAAKRETNTMPQWAGSSWYYLRFMDPHNDNALVDPKVEKYWAPVDVYVGGDHAVRHLIYARFWHKFLYDIGSVSTIEPFARLEFLGFILAEDGRKMSKRYGNVINPTEVVEKVGADVFRLYEMFMGPFENTTAWNQGSINGVSRFIERVWKAQGIVQDAPVLALDTIVEQTVKKVGEDIEAFKFNTAVSQMMILLNAIEKEKAIGKEHWMKFLQVLNPFAPHICYELAELAGFASVAWESWPVADESKLTHDTVTIGVQVNGRVRGTITVALTAPESEVLAAGQAAVAKWLESKEVKKALYIKGKIVTLVV